MFRFTKTKNIYFLFLLIILLKERDLDLSKDFKEACCSFRTFTLPNCSPRDKVIFLDVGDRGCSKTIGDKNSIFTGDGVRLQPYL